MAKHQLLFVSRLLDESMKHKSENGWDQGEDESVIRDLTVGVIMDLTCEIEGIERENPSMSEDEVLELILSKMPAC